MTPSHDASSCFGRRPLFGAISFFIALWFINGCAGFRPAPSDPSALQWMARWASHNTGLKQFKGLMKVQIHSRGQTLHGRAAFAGDIPGRLRLEFLHPLGQPLMSLASDGRNITLIDMQERKIHHLEQTDNALERIIGIPLGIEDLLDVLVGRPALPDYAAAQMAEGKQPCMVELKSRWHDLLADLRSEACERLDTMNVYGREGDLQYTIRWLEWQSAEGHEVPLKVLISSSDGARIDLLIERFWPDASVPPSTFVLEYPEDFPKNDRSDNTLVR